MWFFLAIQLNKDRNLNKFNNLINRINWKKDFVCPNKTILCKENNYCINKDSVCNEFFNFSNCPSLTLNKICFPKKNFHCGNNQSISFHKVCNFIDDCGNNKDEYNCS